MTWEPQHPLSGRVALLEEALGTIPETAGSNRTIARGKFALLTTALRLRKPNLEPKCDEVEQAIIEAGGTIPSEGS